MEEILIQKIEGQEFVSLKDYQKLKEELKDLVERNIELEKKYTIVLTENKNLKEEFKQYKEHYNTEKDKQQIFLMTWRRY